MGAAVVVSRISDPHAQEFLRGHDEEITSMAISRSGLLLASGQLPSTKRNGAGAVIVVWELQAQRELYQLQGFFCKITKMAYSPDDHFLIAAGADGRVILWDMRTSEVVFTKAFPTPVTILNWGKVEEKSRRPKYTLTLACSSQLVVNDLAYDIASMQYKLESFPCAMPSTGLVRDYLSATMTQAKDMLLAGTVAGELVVFHADARVFKCTIPISTHGVQSVVCDAASGFVYVGAGDGVLKKLVGATVEWNLVGHVQLLGAIVGLAVTCDGASLVAGTSAGKLYHIDATHLDVRELATSHVAAVTAVAFGATASDTCVTVAQDGSVKVWDLSTYTVRASAVENAAGCSVCVAPMSGLIVTGWSDGWLRAYAGATGARAWHISGAHRGDVSSVAANDQVVVSGASDGGVNVWSLATRALLIQFHEHKRGVTQVLVDVAKPQWVHSCGLDRAHFIYDLKLERRHVVHQVREGAFHAMGQRVDSENEIVTGGADGRLLFWDCDVAEPVTSMSDPNRMAIASLHVSPSGRYLATGGEDCHVKVFDIGADALIACALGHSGSIRRVTWSPDERQLVSVGDDCCICIWNFFDEQ
ncbi:Aste57867_19385 [Aphanomyces stellatus]|uniref:Aste57867_19385 protein n=1 Tax=Aphanomyces stellatus TaxID=120398 RepID=A0A485LDT8_9STRA|nr:hypothetical protein As57867_019321 [Aphanomyces stellatus]VFT96099.1 Aste57867_19385 [Aphanomyces stellatus]